METIAQDVKSALRTMLARPAFTLMVIITLALGVGANTAIFSIVNAMLIRWLPFDQPEQLVAVYAKRCRQRAPDGCCSGKFWTGSGAPRASSR